MRDSAWWMRRSTRAALPRLALVWLAALAVAACGGVEGPEEDTAAPADDTEEDQDGGTVDGGDSSSDDAADSGAADGTGGTTDAGELDGDSADTATADGDQEVGDGTVEDSADGTDPADSADGEADTTPVKKLPLPDCAKNCTECSKCDDTPMCLDGKTYNNDCEAICELKAYDWPANLSPSQGKCPECKFCTPDDPKELWCATLKNGAKITAEAKCETQCLDLDDKIGTNPTKGPCKSACSKPETDGGGGCSPTAWQPVCAKADGNTYATVCAMQHCDMQGCFGVGTGAKSEQCVAGSMVQECAGECYSKAKWGSCPSECQPVCAIAASGKGVTYRNGCIANAETAKILTCDGVSATSKDQCSASLYAATGAGCCPDVDYTVVKQVCASKGDGASAQWMTFRSMSEYTCLTAAEKDKWMIQYQGPCICNCPQTDKPVCGDDGLTYQNACQAKCYNGDTFNWKEGACK